MTAWLFDLGNTRLKCAPLVDGVVGDVHAVPHAAGGLAAALDAVLPSRFDVAYVASVAGEALRVELLDALVTRCSRIELARTQSQFAGLRIAYPVPARLGVDRFLAMLGARRHITGASLVCGVGTALTIDLVDADGQHRGGRIAPSPELMREALHQRASQLPVAGGDWVEWADDTTDALASGCNGAALALIRDAHDSATAMLGAEPTLLLHGGGAQALHERLPGARFAPALVLDGLACWATT
ncbi:type III pantothenate kinase [Lysobacter sp. HA18]